MEAQVPPPVFRLLISTSLSRRKVCFFSSFCFVGKLKKDHQIKDAAAWLLPLPTLRTSMIQHAAASCCTAAVVLCPHNLSFFLSFSAAVIFAFSSMKVVRLRTVVNSRTTDIRLQKKKARAKFHHIHSPSLLSALLLLWPTSRAPIIGGWCMGLLAELRL